MALQLLPSEDRFARLAYAWLIYLASPLWFAWAGPHASLAAVGLALLAIAAFLPLYFWAYWLEGPRTLLPVGGITLIGLLLTPENAGACVFFVYAAGLAHRVGRPFVGAVVVAGVLLTVGVEAASGLSDQQTSGWAAVTTAVIGGITVYSAEAARKLRVAQDEARHLAVIAERERIGRDLHDVLGHTLSVIALKAELASKVAGSDQERSLAEIREVERISREALVEVRRAVLDSRPALVAEEMRNARIALEAANITLSSDVNDDAFAPAVERTLALAIREAVTNVVRHSSATHCSIHLSRLPGSVRLVVADDGVGGKSGGGSGLLGMRERVRALEGQIEIDGSRGMNLAITLPTGAVPDGAAGKAEPAL